MSPYTLMFLFEFTSIALITLLVTVAVIAITIGVVGNAIIDRLQ